MSSKKTYGPQIFEVFYEGLHTRFHQGEQIKGRVILGLKRPVKTNGLKILNCFSQQ